MKYKVFFVLVLSLVLLSACTMKKDDTKAVKIADDHTPTLYVQPGCSHCEIVETYLTQHKDSGLETGFQTKDVKNDSSATEVFIARSRACGIPDSEMGTPLFYDGTKCYSGSEEVIKYFDSKLQ